MRVAAVTDGIDALAGAGELAVQLRERRVAGHEVDVISVAEALRGGRYDVVHVCAPGPAAALRVARALGLPVVASHDADVECTPSFYGECRVVLSPSRRADDSLARLGISTERIFRWVPGVDLKRFNPARYAPGLLPAGRFNILYVGRLGREYGTDLLAEGFLVARDREPRLHLVLAGAGPEQQRLRARLGTAATFLDGLRGEALASAYASADLFVFPGTTERFGRAILEAQASGLAVLAADVGGHVELIESGRSGCLVPPEPAALASAIRGLARRGAIRERLATGGVLAVAQLSWERSLQQLAAAWAYAADQPAPGSASTREVARAA